MKLSKNGTFLLMIALGLPLIPSCAKSGPITLEELFTTINENKNYTYQYKFEPTDEEMLGFEYIDRYTDYGMYGEIVEDKSTQAAEIGYLVNEKDGVFPYIIEDDKVVPGRARRTNEGEKSETYYDYVTALDDITIDEKDYVLYGENDVYKIKNAKIISKILEASQFNPNKVLPYLENIIINAKHRNDVIINGDFGETGKLIGHIKSVGKTTLKKGKKYLKDGKGAFIATEVADGYQTIIDKFNTNNYQTPLLKLVENIFIPIGTKYFYETTVNGKNAKVMFRDYDDKSVDSGLIELHTSNHDGVYKFTFGPKENSKPDDKKPVFSLLDIEKVEGKEVHTFDEILAFPTSLYMFGKDKLLMDYNDQLKGYISSDYLVSLQLAVYLQYGHTVYFAIPNFAGVRIGENDSYGETIKLIYSWMQDGVAGAEEFTYSNFGKVSLPFVDEFLGGRNA